MSVTVLFKTSMFIFVQMARKRLKLYRSKGERLGWTPLDKIQHISLSSLTVHGRKLSVRSYTEQRSGDATAQQFLIP